MLEIMMQDRFYDALMCMLQSMGDQLRAPSDQSQPSVGVLRRKGRALLTLRKALERSAGDEVDEATMTAIVLLPVLESRFNATAVRDVHKGTIAMLIESKGGLDNFQDGGVFKSSVMQFDTFWAWETGVSMFPGQRRWRDPIYPSNPGSVKVIQDLPIGFRNLFMQGALSYDILSVLTRAMQFCRFDSTQRQDFFQTGRHQHRKFDDFWEACPCLGLQDDRYHPLERLLTMSMLNFVYGIFSPRAFPTGPAGPTPDLTYKLMAFQAATKAEEACQQWMWILAVDLLWTADRRLAEDFSMLELQLRFPRFCFVDAVLELGASFLWTKELTKSVRSYWRAAIFSPLGSVQELAGNTIVQEPSPEIG